VHENRVRRTTGRDSGWLPHCGESYLTADALHEIERIKVHRQALAEERCIAVAAFA